MADSPRIVQWAWVLLLAALLSSCRSSDETSAIAQSSNSAPVSAAPKPSDVKIDSVLLVLPGESSQGRYSWSAGHMTSNIAISMFSYLPGSVVLADYGSAEREITSMLPFNTDEFPEVSEPAIQREIAFTAPTHVLRVKLDDSSPTAWTIEATLQTPDGEKKKTFSGSLSQEYKATQDVAVWVVQNSGWKLSADSMNRFQMPIYGEEYPNYEVLYPKLKEAWAAPVDDSNVLFMLYRKNPENFHILNKYNQMLIDRRLENPIREMASSSFPMKELPAYHSVIADSIALVDMAQARRHLVQFMDAKPGTNYAAKEFIWRHKPSDSNYQDYWGRMEAWHKTSNKSPRTDAWMAGACSNIAAAARGTGWANQVTQEQWRIHNEFYGKAIQYYESSINAKSNVPWVAHDHMNALGQVSDKAGMMKAHRAHVAQFPDDYQSWETILNYARPRWGGSNGEAMKLIDEAMDSRPENGNMGSLAWTYHSGEITIEGRGDTFAEKAKSYFSAHRDRAAQMMRGAKRMRDVWGNQYEFSLYVSYANLCDDFEAVREAARLKPDLYKDNMYSTEWVKTHETRRLFQEGLFANAQWEALETLVSWSLEHDKTLPPGTKPEDNYGQTNLGHRGQFLVAMARLMKTNQPVGAAELRNNYSQYDTREKTQLLLAFALKEQDQDWVKSERNLLGSDPTVYPRMLTLIDATLELNNDRKVEARQIIATLPVLEDAALDPLERVLYKFLPPEG